MSFTTMEQLKTIGRELAMGSQGVWGSSKEFLELVKTIGEAKSKAEEERIVLAEIESLKRRIQEPDVPRKKMKEYIMRLVYVEMLGHDASFGYIHAVKMTHDDNLLLKRSGYLAVTLFLNEDHDLIILIINTIQKDLKSDNYLVCCAALTAVCRLINEETIPAVLPQIVELLNHQKELVRKKAVMALHRFFQRSPSTVSHLFPAFQERLCDRDPSVMSAVLCALYDMILVNVKPFKHLVASLVSILKQAVEHRLPKSYDYHRTPAPFVQIKLLKILALLGTGDKAASENMFNVLGDILKRSDSTSNIGNAILYECVRTLTSIYTNPRLLQNAAEITAKFLKSDNHNLKYMGIDALGRLIKITPECAENHQLAVIDCLEDPDDTLKRKTLDLLYKMTKANNVEVIVERMVEYIRNISDNHYKTEISSRVIELAERYAPSNQWFIQTMNQVFEIAGDLVPQKVAHDLMRLIAEGAGEEDEDADSHLRSSAVQAYLQILKEPKLPSILLQVISWVLGEYGIADGSHSAEFIIGKLCDIVATRPGDDKLKGYVVSAITKICAFEKAAGQTVDLIPECVSFIEELYASHSTDLQQRIYEFHAVLKLDRDTIASILPMDASCEDIEVDKDLSFLNSFVESALANGSRPYLSDNERRGMGAMTTLASNNDAGTSSLLRFQPYEKPSIPEPAAALVTASHYSQDAIDQHDIYSSTITVSTSSRAPESSSNDGTRLKLEGVQKKWGRPTYTPEAQVPKNPINISDSVKVSSSAAGKEASSRNSSAPPYTERKQPSQEISAEKKKLAASLFGSKAGETKAKPAAKLQQNGTSKKAPAKPTSPPAPAPAPPPADLLDLSDSLPQIPSVDPVDQLADLISVDSSAATSTTSLVEQVLDAGKVATKGPSPQASLQKDSVSRQVGVTPSGGTNPDLFKDLFG
ncbi:AP-4 complex subunit epsilon [Selaginella moellendorffii]|uniref:AP-4 complex subunit epsilon n=1 Tax=Selaginella moellendorffii TaxID=88036 RepID=UPI000D1CBB38|nr:AP-4 complex subunit epsilon [Selaginella moellendorffii]|eukprot:XP_024531548.1 AP-4 complex subunit epsilon [Selaginella moellendorffii]